MEAGSGSVAVLKLLAIVLVFGLVLLWFDLRRKPVVRAAAKSLRPLKPKTGADCPLCRTEQGACINERAIRARPRPWREGRSRHGRKKESGTEGYACDRVSCLYYGITDADRPCSGCRWAPHLHWRCAPAWCQCGKYERIQDLKCQACGHKFTVRRHSVLYRLKTQSVRVAEALTFLAEGVDGSVLGRAWQMGEGSLRRWLTRAGLHAEKVHEHFFRGLRCEHVQLDELWANAC